jgi:hypothetical protein
MIAFGTGGESEADVIGLETLFREPKGYSINECVNIWEEGAKNSVAFFSPYTYNLPGFMDDEGNSELEKAISFSDGERSIKKNESRNPIAYSQHCAEHPYTPAEALLRTGGTIFPIIDIGDRLGEIETDSMITDSIDFGRLRLSSGDSVVEWKRDTELIPIFDFPYRETNKDSAVIIYQHPIKRHDGRIANNVYIAGTDPYANDTGDSLGSTFVMNRVSGLIVAEYTARPVTDQIYYENVRRLLLYYNAICNYENNIKGMFSYFEKTNCLHLLADTPRLVADKINDRRVLNRGKGTPATESINKWSRELIKNYLLEMVNDEGLTNTYRIKSIPLLKELKMWKSDGNFDRVSALGMLMILREEYHKVTPENIERAESQTKIMSFFDRPFW